jgi:hypothetical protein
LRLVVDMGNHKASVSVVPSFALGAASPLVRSLHSPTEDQILRLVWLVPEWCAPECGLCGGAVAAAAGELLVGSCGRDHPYQSRQAEGAAEVLLLQTSWDWHTACRCTKGGFERLRVYKLRVLSSTIFTSAELDW